MYTVSAGEQTQEFPTRSEAIAAAKELSSERHFRVNVRDEDGRESMIYREGELESYEYETRRRRRRDD